MQVDIESEEKNLGDIEPNDIFTEFCSTTMLVGSTNS